LLEGDDSSTFQLTCCGGNAEENRTLTGPAEFEYDVAQHRPLLKRSLATICMEKDWAVERLQIPLLATGGSSSSVGSVDHQLFAIRGRIAHLDSKLMDIINHCDDETMSRLVYVNRVCATASWIPIRANKNEICRSDTGNHCLSVSYAPLDLVIECGSVELSNVHTIRCSLLSAAVMRLFCFTPPMRLVICLRRQCNTRACTEEV
jgi:hypothetical protein